MGYVIKCLPILAVLLLTTSCDDSMGGTQTPSPPATTIISVLEKVPIRTATRQTDVTWLEPTGAGKSWQEVNGARSQVEQAIRDAATRLNGIDYIALSLPDFVTSTRVLKLEAKDFTAGKIAVEAFGKGKSGERWTLYEWQGPEIPQHPDRLVVHRWIKTYALYNMDTRDVTLLLATIRGEAHE